ncbi:MAG: DNA mismatch repair protein MutS [Fimbriimonadales bacterium]|nr:DNA mismatch repair protein MutS [Fimbriimonadales bacterium]
MGVLKLPALPDGYNPQLMQSSRFQPQTPMLQQYFRLKAEHPDVLLAMQVGDFYEFYGEDAEIAARELEIVLTGREDGSNGRIPMAGVPVHAYERYIARLVQKGYRVALCDQVEDPKLAKGLVKRRVTRILTPGTVLEDSMLDARANNYLVAAVLGEPVHGLGVVDVSTGEFLVTEIAGERRQEKLLDELFRLQPAEVLVPEDQEELMQTLREQLSATITPVPLHEWVGRDARKILLQHFGVESLRGFGCEEYTRGLEAAALALRYLQHNHLEALQHIRTLATYSVERFMYLDATARRHLELTRNQLDGTRRYTLLATLDSTCTPMGARLLKRWLDEPLLDPEAINQRLDAVEALVRHTLHRDAIRQVLRPLADLERLVARASTGTANARDLVALRNTLQRIPELYAEVNALLSALERPPTLLASLAPRLAPMQELCTLLERALVDDPPTDLKSGGIIRDGYDPELDRLRQVRTEGKNWIAQLEAQERQRTGIPSLKVGYNAVFGYYIEVSKPHLSKVPPHYIRKQTLVNAERFITPELKEQEAILLGAEERANALEFELFTQLRAEVARQTPQIQSLARAIAELDVLCAFAENAVRYRYTRPIVDTEDRIYIYGGRHPVVERFSEQPFVPNDCRLDSSQRLIILTGPNMSGKSTYIRQNALITLMAHIGSFVPADRAEIGVVDRIFTRVGARDELATGQSTFMVEMTETANILNNATARSLVILDEIGRGTSTYDGLAIAWAVAEYLHAIGCKTLFATHYHYLNELANRLEGVANYRVAVKEQGDRIIWLHKVLPGGTDRSYGVHVARMAGVPPEVVQRAEEILRGFERHGVQGSLQPPSSESPIVRKKKLQLTLFEATEHPVLEALRELDITTLSPIEALMKLDELKRKLEAGS